MTLVRNNTPLGRGGTAAFMLARAVLFLVIGLAAVGCGSLTRNAVPQNADLDALLAAPSPIRFWGDQPPKDLEAAGRLIAAQRAAAGEKAERVINYLAISGGGADGAFGAGLLTGWSEAGTRPKFDFVTGVSTGALTAPFAFLGPAYDSQLKEVYTTYGDKDIAQQRSVFSIFGEASVADNTPLAKLVERYVTPEFVKAVADEHRKGRRLLIATTHLDAQRPVIWNMGAIAARDDAEAVDLFRRVMIASASIPGVFPPVLIKVHQDGQTFDEMHVDGGVAGQVFIFPTQVDPRILDRKLRRKVERRLYIIRNGRLFPEWKSVEPRLVPIASRSISSLIKYQGRGDLDRMYLQSRAYNVDFNLASIPPSFTLPDTTSFDRDYMNALFDVGYELGRAGYKWQKKPPAAQTASEMKAQ